MAHDTDVQRFAAHVDVYTHRDFLRRGDEICQRLHDSLAGCGCDECERTQKKVYEEAKRLHDEYGGVGSVHFTTAYLAYVTKGSA